MCNGYNNDQYLLSLTSSTFAFRSNAYLVYHSVQMSTLTLQSWKPTFHLCADRNHWNSLCSPFVPNRLKTFLSHFVLPSKAKIVQKRQNCVFLFFVSAITPNARVRTPWNRTCYWFFMLIGQFVCFVLFSDGRESSVDKVTWETSVSQSVCLSVSQSVLPRWLSFPHRIRMMSFGWTPKFICSYYTHCVYWLIRNSCFRCKCLIYLTLNVFRLRFMSSFFSPLPWRRMNFFAPVRKNFAWRSCTVARISGHFSRFECNSRMITFSCCCPDVVRGFRNWKCFD